MDAADAYIGEIRLIPYRFVPVGWYPCDGRLLEVTTYPALYSVIGNNFGGVGPVNFKLPDLRGSVAIGAGSGPGLTPRKIGHSGGKSTVGLTTAQLPMHDHTFTAFAPGALPEVGSIPADQGGVSLGVVDLGSSKYTTFPTYENTLVAKTNLHANTVGKTGQSPTELHSNVQPYQAFMYCICYYSDFYPTPPA